MNTIIQRLDGTTYDFEALGITTRDFVVSSPSPRHYTEEIGGMDGAIDLGTDYEPRPISASFYAKAADFDDYGLMRDEIFRMLRTKESFYVIESRNPGKRWKVKVNNSYGLDQQYLYGFFDVEFIAHSGVAESVGTTADPFTFDAEKWGVGLGLTEEVYDYAYTYSTNAFRIINAGDVAINPRYMPIKITFKGASNDLTITNTTTGDQWVYNGSSNASDTIILDGIRSTKNGLSIFRDTNKRLITIAPGLNDFTISGSSSFSITFDFRFYYL